MDVFGHSEIDIYDIYEKKIENINKKIKIENINES